MFRHFALGLMAVGHHSFTRSQRGLPISVVTCSAVVVFSGGTFREISLRNPALHFGQCTAHIL